MNQLVVSRALPSYRDQTPAVRARFERIKARDVILRVEHQTPYPKVGDSMHAPSGVLY